MSFHDGLLVSCFGEAGSRLNAGGEVISLAANMFNRFREKKPELVQYDPYNFIAASLKLSAWLHERLLDPTDLVLVIYQIVRLGEPAPTAEIVEKLLQSIEVAAKIITVNLNFELWHNGSYTMSTSDVFRHYKEASERQKRRPVETINIEETDEDVIVEDQDIIEDRMLEKLPRSMISSHRFLVHYLKAIKLIFDSRQKNLTIMLANASWTFLNDFFWSPAAIRIKPDHLACACVLLASDMVKRYVIHYKIRSPEELISVLETKWNLLFCDDLNDLQADRLVHLIIEKYNRYKIGDIFEDYNNLPISHMRMRRDQISADVSDAIRICFRYGMRFCLGYLMGAFIWLIIIHPYSAYFSFGQWSIWAEWILCLSFGFISATNLKARAVMTLFLPSMLGSAAQNYIIVILFVSLFTNPVLSIGHNVIESIRVVGCAITMTFEQLKDRAKLTFNPIVDALRGHKQDDLVAVQRDLIGIQRMVNNLRDEAEFSRNELKEFEASLSPGKELPSVKQGAMEIKTIAKVDDSTAHQLADKVTNLIKDSQVTLDKDSLGLKVSFNRDEISQLILASANASHPLGEFNLTQIMHENCLSIFRRAKLGCEASAQSMRNSCTSAIGSLLSFLLCSPVSMGVSTLCPSLMDQLIDQNSICNQMQASISNLRTDPFNVTDGADIEHVYKNLTAKIDQLTRDLLDSGQSTGRLGNQTSGLDDDSMRPRRIELKISFNDQTRKLFAKTKNIINFVSDKYRRRYALLLLLKFAYDIYSTITFIRIFQAARQYHSDYLVKIAYDNHFISRELVELDQRRQNLGLSTVMPLDEEESREYVTTFTCKRRSREERKEQRASALMVILFLCFTLTLIYFDKIFHDIQTSIRRRALIYYRESGHHELELIIRGDGSMADLVRKLLGKLHTVYDLNKLSNNRQCLPIPRRTRTTFYWEYLYLVLLYSGVDQITIYARRLRRLIMSHYYPDYEKQRTIYLHNFILAHRETTKETGLKSDELSGANDDLQAFHSADKAAKIDQQLIGLEPPMYTIRDAIGYISQCISDSLICCGDRRRLGNAPQPIKFRPRSSELSRRSTK